MGTPAHVAHKSREDSGKHLFAALFTGPAEQYILSTHVRDEESLGRHGLQHGGGTACHHALVELQYDVAGDVHPVE